MTAEADEGVEKEEHLEAQTGASTVEILVETPQNAANITAIWPSYSTPGYLLKGFHILL